MPYQDRSNNTCGFLDIEEKECSGHFVRRFFRLDYHQNVLEYFMDNPQVNEWQICIKLSIHVYVYINKNNFQVIIAMYMTCIPTARW